MHVISLFLNYDRRIYWIKYEPNYLFKYILIMCLFLFNFLNYSEQKKVWRIIKRQYFLKNVKINRPLLIHSHVFLPILQNKDKYMLISILEKLVKKLKNIILLQYTYFTIIYNTLPI